MLLIEYVDHRGLRSLTDGHLGRHLEYFKTLNDARVASVGFIKYNASTTRINKETNFKIKFQVILVFYWTKVNRIINTGDITNLTKFRIFFTVQFSYSREIIHWHEIARTGFQKK